MAVERQVSALPPAQPSYIFRGHTAQIHSVHILRQNTRLLTGDADGWIVCWKLEAKRPVAVWRAHDGAILGTGAWGLDKVITHGRDHCLRIWQLRTTDELTLSSVLPADGPDVNRPQPWLLHSLPVNTLNFCAFSMCHELPAFNNQQRGHVGSDQGLASPTRLSDSILVAVPSRDDRKIEVYRFPDETLAYAVPRVQPTDTGMVMALKLAHHRSSNSIVVIAGYEGGFTAVHYLGPNSRPNIQTPTLQVARVIYLSQPHTQPVLSLDASPDAKTFFSSAADAVVAAHRIPEPPLNIGDAGIRLTGTSDTTSTRIPTIRGFAETRHLDVQDDTSRLVEGSIEQDSQQTQVAPAELGNAHSRTQLPNTSKEASSKEPAEGEEAPGAPIAESGPHTLPKTPPPASSSPPTSPMTFDKQPVTAPSAQDPKSTSRLNQPSGLSSLLSSTANEPRIKPEPPPMEDTTVQPPHRTVNTKHAGQQSLSVRSDGRILVTAGWDSRIRIYSTKSLKELAVLKWHKEGVYATAFGEIFDQEPQLPSNQDNGDIGKETGDAGATAEQPTADNNSALMPPLRGGDGSKVTNGLGRLQHQREVQMQMKHWVVAGSKDGKVSLWEIY